jgi:hypothetical protein
MLIALYQFRELNPRSANVVRSFIPGTSVSHLMNL